jgi:hypothetical protein
MIVCIFPKPSAYLSVHRISANNSWQPAEKEYPLRYWQPAEE